MQKSIFYFKRINMYNRIVIMLFISVCSLHALAQDSTKRQQSIDINSAYKPVLRNAVKINFSGSQLSADTSRPVFNYNIPAQNLFYAYQPISLRPLALAQDSNLYLGTRKYLKVGFGSYTTPYVKAGLSFGDGKTSLVNITGSYIASKGNDIKYQDYSQLNIKGSGSYFGEKNEVYASAAVSQNKYYLYGYDHGALPNINKDDIRNQFQEITLSGGFRNTVSNELGLSYNPNMEINFFNSKDKVNETNIKVTAPVEKTLGESFSIKVEAKADITKYSTVGVLPDNIKVDNNIVQIAPSILYASQNIKFNGGVVPVWNNGDFTLLPNIQAEAQLPEKTFALQGGWVGRFVKNNYRSLSGYNPYIGQVFSQTNTKEMEYYGGIKATLGKHFNFSAKAGLVQYTNLALFVNDTSLLTTQNEFKVVNESKAKNFRIHGDVGYINQDKFTFTAGLTLNGYTNLKDNDKAWGTIPMEFTSSLRWWAFKRFMLKADAYLFGGSKYLEPGGGNKTSDGGTDISIGAEYRINKQFSLWLDANNLLNDKYERWHKYEVYGLNLTGGILIKF